MAFPTDLSTTISDVYIGGWKGTAIRGSEGKPMWLTVGEGGSGAEQACS